MDNTQTLVEDILRIPKTKKIAQIDDNTVWAILGYRSQNKNWSSYRVVVVPIEGGGVVAVWSNKQLAKRLDKCHNFVESHVDRFEREICWSPRDMFLVEENRAENNPEKDDTEQVGLYICVQPAQQFYSSGGTISWNPISVEEATDPQKLATLQEAALEKEYEKIESEATYKLLPVHAPHTNETTKALDMPAGEYICRKYTTTIYRGNRRTLLFLLLVGEDGESTTDVEIPVYGYFLEKEIEQIGALEEIASPMLCKKTTTKKKDRIVHIAATKYK